jgi:uncharacterized protein involved in outer membrane biogenesis
LCGVKKLSKAILIGLAVLVALGIVVAGSLIIYLQSAGSQARIEEELSKSLHVPLKITNVGVWPPGVLDISGITIPNGDANFLEAASFKARYRWLPLLHGELVVTEMSVESPKIVWGQTVDGKWKLPDPQDAAKTTAKLEKEGGKAPEKTGVRADDGQAPKEEAEKPAVKKKSNFAVIVQRFDVKGGSVELLDKDNKHLAVFENVNVTYTTLTADQAEGTATIGKLTWADTFGFEHLKTPFKYSKGNVELPEISADFAGGKMLGRYVTHEEPNGSPYKLAVTVNNVDLSGVATQPGGAAGELAGILTGQLEIHGDAKQSDRLDGEAHFDLRDGQFHQLDPFLNMAQLLGMGELANLRVRTGHTDLRFSGNKVLVEKLVLNTSDLQLTGQGTIRLDNKKVNLAAQLSADDAVVQRLPDLIRSSFKTADTGRRVIDFKINGDMDKPKTDLLDKLGKKTIDNQFNSLLGLIFNQVKKPEDDKPKKDEKKSDKDHKKKGKDQAPVTPAPAASTPAPATTIPTTPPPTAAPPDPAAANP